MKTQSRYIFYKKRRQGESSKTASKQKDASSTALTHFSPKIPFFDLLTLYERSFVVRSVAELVATTASQGFTYDEKSISADTKNILESIPLKELFLNMFVFGNYFLEKLSNRFGKVQKVCGFLTKEVKCRKGGGITQFSSAGKVDFEADEIVHIKETSLSSRVYGESRLSSCVHQLTLLALIDRYYNNLFDGGMMGTKIFYTKENAQMTEKEASILHATLSEKSKGVDNAFDTMILPFELGSLNIDDPANTEKFLKYREELIHSVALSFGIPVELLLPHRATRATMAESIARFNTDVIFPLQQSVMQQIRNALRDDFPDIDGVDILAVDTKNQMQEMEILTGYMNARAMSVNEVRAKLSLDAVEGGDALMHSPTQGRTDDMKEIEREMGRVAGGIAKMYGYDEI